MRNIKSLLLLILFCVLLSKTGLSQTRNAFTGDPTTFIAEFSGFMGPNLNAEQSALLNSFSIAWDSTMLAEEQKQQIILTSGLLVNKRMRPVPHFAEFLYSLMAFVNYDVDKDLFGTWLEGLEQLASLPSTQVSQLLRFIESGGMLITDRLLYRSGGSTWGSTSNKYSFVLDTVFKIIIPSTDLICYSQYDSTIISNTGGIYLPYLNLWIGNGGIITWEKAGYEASEVFGELENYSINTTKSFFDVDSVKLMHFVYFPEGVMGKLSDRAVKISNPETASYPRFSTYQKKFNIDNIFENINFEGGLAFEGSKVRGTGDKFQPSKLTVFRNDTLYALIKSVDFLFDNNNIKSQSTSFTFYLDQDSIYHSDIAFSFNEPMRELNTYRSTFPTSKSPYFSSYHGMDMYFEYLTWKLDESRIILSRARGASLGQAYFESVSFFNENEFHRLMGLDEYHPLYRVSRFAEYYYNDTFPVDLFAQWLQQPPENATALCIDLANKGFLFYDRANDEVTIKKKLYDYINSYAKRQDYDVMSILSETNAPLDNAILDMHNYKMSINGVPRIFLSDSQNVAIFPYGRQIVMEKNRSFSFDGVVQAGMITIFGHNFRFNYDTFKIDLINVDSIMLSVEIDERDETGGILSRQIEDLIQMTKAELLIDNPENKSGLMSLEQYPIFRAISESYVFYDRIPGLEGVYPQSDFYFRLEPFSFENTDRLREEMLTLEGEFTGGKIMPTLKQTLTLQEDKSLGFLYNTEEEGLEIYEGKAVMYNSITMSNTGLKGQGQLNYLTASAQSDEFRFFPDSMLATAESFSINSNTLYPEVSTSNTEIKWYPGKDEWIVDHITDDEFNMFDNGTRFDGKLLLTSENLSGAGEINFTDSRLVSDKYDFGQKTIQADSAEYNLKSVSGDGYAFIAEDANTFIDFANQTSRFNLNTDSSLVKFPEVNYICTMTDFEYDMNSKILSMTQRGREESTLMPPDELLKQDFSRLEEPTFFSTHMMNDTLTFSSGSGRYLVQEEKLIAENVNYIKIADALIQPDNGIFKINKGARFDRLYESVIGINNKHLIYNASVNIMRSDRYTASGNYHYIDEEDKTQIIRFDEIIVDSLRSKGTGQIPRIQNFMLSPNFTFLGDVHLKSENEFLNFLGSSGIIHNCENIGSAPMKFNADIDPNNILIPVSDKPRDINGNLITAGSYITIDSTHIYSAFLSPAKSWSDIALIPAKGWLFFDKSSSTYKIAEKEKLANTSLPGSMVTFDRNFCRVYSEGPATLGTDYVLFNTISAGNVTHDTDSNIVNIHLIMALDFHFSEPALTVMADEIRYIPTLESVDMGSEWYTKSMQDLIGYEAASTLKEEMDLFGISRSLPEGFNPEIVLNDLNLVWYPDNDSYRSVGKIGIGFIGSQAVNLMADGFVEIQKRRSGDLLDVYLKVDESTWYWFSYTRGVLMAIAGNNSFNTILREDKLNARKHPDNSIRTPYTYMIGVQDRLDAFLRRMTLGDEEEEFFNNPIDFKNP